MIDEAEEILSTHFGSKSIFNRADWEYIVKELDGKIPIRVCAVPEGSVVPVKNVLFTVESTDEKVPWVANYFEALLVQTWWVFLSLNESHNIVMYIFAQIQVPLDGGNKLLCTKEGSQAVHR